MRRLLSLAVLALFASNAYAQDKISGFSAAGTQTGTELITEVQSGANVNTTPAQITTYVNGHAVIPLATGVSGNLPIANAPSIASPTVIGNYSGSTGTGSALNPLQIANMQAAVLSVRVVATSNIATLSGSQTIDGIALSPGETALLTAQTSAVNDGIYVVQTGAWTRAANFPAAYVIAQYCDLKIDVTSGTLGAGTSWLLGTAAGALTIGTSSLNFVQIVPTSATTTVAGAVKITTNTHTIVSSFGGTANLNDCVSFATASGDINDQPNLAGLNGPCVISDSAGHPFTSSATPPTVTGTGCSLIANSGDSSGGIVATGADTCTLTFGGAFTVYAPFCVVAGYSATVLPFISTAPTTTAVVIHTAAAGTASYYCSN